MSASLNAVNASSPTASRLTTHWMVPVESRSTMKRRLLLPLLRFTQPFRVTCSPSWSPDWTAPM